MAQYRSRTIALLLKYFRMSVEMGHLPSLFGREFFRSNVSSYATHTFEDTAIFVLDMERVLAKLEAESQAILARVLFQQYEYDEAAALLRTSRRSLARKVAQALDACSEILIEFQLMEAARVPVSATTARLLSRNEELPPKKPCASAARIESAGKFCQEGKFYKSNANG